MYLVLLFQSIYTLLVGYCDYHLVANIGLIFWPCPKEVTSLAVRIAL